MAKTARLIGETNVHVATANNIVWSPDGTRLALSGNGGLSVLTIGGPIVNFGRFACAQVEWSPDGQRLVDGGWGGRTPCIREAATGAVLVDIDAHPGGFDDVKWSPDNGLLALASWQLVVHIYDPEAGCDRRTLSGHYSPITGVSWCPGGQQLVSGAKDGGVRIWAAMTGRVLFAQAHQKGVSHVGWSPDGRRVAAAFTDGSIRIWDATSYRLTAVLPAYEEGFTTLSWASNSRYLAAGTLCGTVILWDVSAERRIGQIDYAEELRLGRALSGLMGDHRVEHVAFAPEGDRLATLFAAHCIVRLWDTSGITSASFGQRG